MRAILADTCSLAALLCTVLPAQRDLEAGFGRRTLNVDPVAVTGNSELQSVQELGGVLYIPGADRTNGHQVYVLDRKGKLLRQFAQPAGTAVSPWGWRDGATDGASLMFGFEGGIHVVDTSGKLATRVLASKGLQTLASNPITGPGLAAVNGTYRAIAYNPAGNGGFGSFFVASVASDIVEIDLQGAILKRYSVPTLYAFGLARDAMTGRLWINGLSPDGPLVEFDPQTGSLTGVTLERESLGFQPGGLCVVAGGLDGRNQGSDLAMLRTGGRGAVVGYRLHLWNGVDGTNEVSLLAAVDGEHVSDAGRHELLLGAQTIDIDLSRSGVSAVALFNMKGDAVGSGSTSLVPELVVKGFFTQPQGLAVNYGFVSNGKSMRAPAVTLPSILSDGEAIRVQVIYLEPKVPAAALPLMATNQIRYIADYSRQFTVEAVGANSWNSDIESGFFRVIYKNIAGKPLSLTEVTLDGTQIASRFVFDVDQGGMSDYFDAGNGSAVGCQGTYRKGSALSCGLIFDALNTAPTSLCALSSGANTGFLGTSPGSSPGDYQVLKFRFSAGTFIDRVFEFDCDTDGGAGMTGADMAGMLVTLRFSDGSVRQGTMAKDPNNPLRAFASF